MTCTRAVAVVLGTLLALTQTEVVKAGVATAHVSGFRSGTAHSQTTDQDGTVRGECAYLDGNGQSIKISYKKFPNGQLVAETDPPVQNAAEVLKTCRRAAKAASKAVEDSIQKTQQEIFHQQQLLQQQIFHQNQAFQPAFQFPPFFGAPNQFPFGQQYL